MRRLLVAPFTAALVAAALVAATFFTATLPAAAAEPMPGYDRFTVVAPHRPTPLAGSIWYPAQTPTYRGLVGDNAVFRGESAWIGAAAASGPFPLVIASHGSGGSMDGLAWLSSALAARGVLVAAINHPGSSSGDSSPRRSILLHERATDLTALLDHVLADPVFGSRVDRTRIVALGFSLGGATVLMAAGARFDRAAYRDYCTRMTDAGDCVFFAKGGVELAALPAALEGDLRDRRLSGVVAVDPGMGYALGFRDSDPPAPRALLINSGTTYRWPAIDFGPKGSNLAARIPGAQSAEIASGHHFTFLPVCKAEGPALLVAERDDPVCDDPPATDRNAVHAEIADLVTAFVKR
jgi:predicted dienelactone hydrolase